VGAIMMVGGNIRSHTPAMTTTIALKTSRGDRDISPRGFADAVVMTSTKD
jgi:ABC-type tungstate transport system substrate-binding protein